jgi:hypothetical protein
MWSNVLTMGPCRTFGIRVQLITGKGSKEVVKDQLVILRELCVNEQGLGFGRQNFHQYLVEICNDVFEKRISPQACTKSSLYRGCRDHSPIAFLRSFL